MLVAVLVLLGFRVLINLENCCLLGPPTLQVRHGPARTAVRLQSARMAKAAWHQTDKDRLGFRVAQSFPERDLNLCCID